jgi:acyl transferase domain-containing protein/acyl carrier protein/NADP-dependent 3-hydroxy acid dehydrogenase YdfG
MAVKANGAHGVMQMKQELGQIYYDVSKGRLSRTEALERIKAIKLREQGRRHSAMLFVPVWRAAGLEISAEAGKVEYAEYHVILCELSKINVRELECLVAHSRCLSLHAAEHRDIAERYSEYALACLERIQTIFRGRHQGKVLVQIVVAAGQEQAIFAGLSGLLKTAALENPQFMGQLILVPASITTGELTRCLLEEKTGGMDSTIMDPLIRYDQGARQVLRWQEVPANPEKPGIVFKDNGVYLITGGLGGLGVLFTQEILAQTRESRVVLTGRSALGGEKQDRFDGLAAQADRLSYRQVDLLNLGQVQQLIDAIQHEYGTLNGIIHSAGMIADEFILKKAGVQFSEVLAPKVTGTFNLDQASRDVALDFFVLFSSVAGAMGNAGQADYAAANGFMDQFAGYRNEQVAAKQRCGRTRSINWAMWQAGGMGIDAASQELLRQTTGMQPMQTAAGIGAFYRSLELPCDQVLVAEGHLSPLRRALLAGRPILPEPSLVGVGQSVAAETDATGSASDSIVEKTQNYLRRQFSELLKLPSHKIDPQAALEKYGIDSILAMKLTNQLEKTFGALSKTLFFEYQTIDELTQYFIHSHSGRLSTLFAATAKGNRQTKSAGPPEKRPHAQSTQDTGRRPIPQRSLAPTPSTDADSIAIIGLSGRYPEALDIDAFWQNLRDGKDSIIEIPKERWDWRKYFSADRTESGHHYSKWGGFISGVDEFDPLFFNMSPREAKYTDPQERLFLQHAWMAIEDAGYTRASLQVPDEQDLAGQVGVYVGVMFTEYQLFGAEANVRNKRLAVGSSAASIANRVSYVLNLHGPSMTLDTMCSSSLTAIHVACQDLKQGRTVLAIAGGVNVTIHPNKYLVLSAGQFISSDGHCQSFGKGGDGYIPGEGVGAVVLKRLSDARRDADHIYGVIRGSAITHGGKTNGYTVPNPQAQTSAISRALAESHIDARHVSYIEAHGTGTRLGDPIEIAALSKAFRQYSQDTEFCLIGSVKSNIGHCESAAGIAGLTKVLLQMQHRQIVPSLHSAQLNPHIDFARSPFVVNQELRSWEPPVVDGRPLPRIAGISSFGAGGSNAHMIVEEYQPPMQEPRPFEKVAILLSARTAAQLQQKACDLLDFVRPRLKTLDLVALSYTLQVGREAMEERLGLVVSSVESLVEKLQAYVAGEQSIEDAYHGQVKRNQESLSLFSTDADLQQMIEKWIVGRKLFKLLELWVRGLELDWSRLYGEGRPGRMSLPAYPFSRERFWIDAEAGEQVAVGGAATAVLHPLLHRNTSDLSEQRYSSTFTGEEFFLADHQVKTNGHAGQKVLPAVAYLEMTRVAIEHALPARPESAVLELRNTVWQRPIVVSGNMKISIALLPGGNDQIDYEIYSQDPEQEVVHCKGRAAWSREVAPARLDVGKLRQQMHQGQAEPASVYAMLARTGLVYGPAFQGITAIHRGSGQVLAQLRLPKAVQSTSGDYVLHPSLMESALQVAVLLDESEGSRQKRLLFALESLRIVSSCTREMFAWARYSPGGHAEDGVCRLDMDLCDEHGNISAQMRGISWQQASLEIVEPVLNMAAPSAVPAGPKEIALTPVQTAWQVPADSSVRLFDCDSGIFAIEICESVAGNRLTKDVIAGVLEALERVRQEASLKVLMVKGAELCFLRGGREDSNEAIEQGLYQAMVSFPGPVIATLRGDATGAGFMVAALCDFMVCSEDASCGYTDTQTCLYPTPSELLLFSERFGAAQVQDFLYASSMSSGRQLRAKGWTCPILPEAQVEVYAQKLASTLATKSQEALRLLKQHMTRHLVGLVKELKRVEPMEPAENPSNTVRETVASPAEHIHLDMPVENVLVIKFCVAAGNVTVKDLVADLGSVFASAHQIARCRAIVLVSEYPDFLPGTKQAIAGDVVMEFQRLIVESQIPVIAALNGNATGSAWFVSQFCDACVYSEKGVYSAFTLGQTPEVTQTAAAISMHRFGNTAGAEFLLTSADYSGLDLRQRMGALMVAEPDQVLPAALRVAESWARLPRTALAVWKKHSAAVLHEKVRSIPVVAEWESEDETHEQLAAPTAIGLQSKVVTATAYPEGIVVVKMEDREAKNMFSDAFNDGLIEAFAHIERSRAYKVVILTGYDNYFASGGTKESLLAIQAGKVRFTDSSIFQVALDCKLPVIAALQGHGIGAGWTLGMFADVVLLSEESRYLSPYMNYGFTPGAGATFILADKIGHDLARESLLTGQHYAGSDLKQRGLPLLVLPRVGVHAAAMRLARQMAQSSRGRLTGLKQQLTAYVRQPLAETHRLELAMHEKTFVGQSDALEQIHRNFYQEIEAPPVSVPLAPVEPANPSVDSDVLRAVAKSLKTMLAAELQTRESDIDETAQFIDLGLDSIIGVTWVRKINDQYHTSIEATKIYSYPTLSQLSRYVQEAATKHGTLPTLAAHAPAAAEMPVSSGKSASSHSIAAGDLAGAALTVRRSRPSSRFASPPSAHSIQPIAVIGVAGQFPQARNLDEFWRNIAQGKNCITPVPPERWDVNALYQPGNSVEGKTNSRWAGVLDEYDLFDPLFFNISPAEAESMDPQQRLFLQACWHGIENAGYNARVLSGSKCGVFVGCASGDYRQLSRKNQLSAQGFTGGAMSILAARISYFLNLQGPCISIDTACSSSLVAIASACDSLISGGSDLALAGGVFVMSGPELHISTSQAGMLSPRGECSTFDQRADGFVPGECVGVVLLKRLADAQRDNDIIQGVIYGWGVNQDGKTNGITAPNPESQTRLEQEVYDKYQIDPASIQLIEAHGTGTKLGDPIEVEGLKNAFKKYTHNKEYCALGSVKSNIGHCLAAAGIAGVIKLILALKHRQLPPTINFERLNEHIELKDSPFYVTTRLQPWEPGGAQGRQAAISSFGFSGTNAHMVIGEFLPSGVKPPVPVVAQNTKVIIPLSARTAAQLKQRACDLLDFIRGQAQHPDLMEMAYTLQVGREPMEERLGFVVSSVEHLAEKLQAWVSGDSEIKDLYVGQVKRNRESMSIISQDDEVKKIIVAKWIAEQKLSKLLDLWVKGLDVDWSRLYGEIRPRRMSLPVYPFAKERYWIDSAAGAQVASSAVTAVLHPLLHRNTSDLSVQRYTSTFTGEEFFLADHQVKANGHSGQKVLPAVAYLEMARAAIEQSMPAWPESMVLGLHNTTWAQPMVVSENREISIALVANDHDCIDYEIYSQDADQEIVHCQGRAVWSRAAPLARLDVEQLKGEMGQGKVEPGSVYAAFARMGLVYGPSFQGIAAIHLGNRQLLAQLRLPRAVEDRVGGFVLHPAFIEGALQASFGLMDGSYEGSDQLRMPLALESLLILAPCTREMIAWVRYAPGSQAGNNGVKLDIDLCDDRGNITAQLRGISWQQTSLSLVEPVIKEAVPAAHQKIDAAAPVSREITFIANKQASLVPSDRKKPNGISLAAPSALPAASAASSGDRMRPPSARRAPITLSKESFGSPVQKSKAPAASSVRLFDRGNGIFSIRIAGANDNQMSRDVIAELRQALDWVQQEPSVKVLMLSGVERCFLRGGREDYNEAIKQGLFPAIASFPWPVIAVLQGDATGAGLMVAALCDFMVCNEDAAYGYTDARNGFYPTTPEAMVFSERFGTIQAQDFVYVPTVATGSQLRAKGWTCPIVPGQQVEAFAQKLAANLATKSQEALRLLKQHLTRRLAGLAQALARVEAAAENPSNAVDKTIVSPGRHLHLDTPTEDVLVIKFCSGNVEIKELVAEIRVVFTRAHQIGACKAIVLASEHANFLSGTNQAIPEDAVVDFQRLILDSQIPVVAALDGNATGNAWLISQFCDTCVYNEKGVYSSAGIGSDASVAQTSVAIFTQRFGNSAGREILLTGADYTGVDLQQRVSALLVAATDQVLPAALRVAESWSRLPLAALAAWKKQTATIIQKKISSIPVEAGWEEKDETPWQLAAATTPIALNSRVVTAVAHPGGIVVVKMEDREAKNMFSEALSNGLVEAFAHIERSSAYKVVILTGYDKYFASGGTKEGLQAIQSGNARFTDSKIFQLAVDCKLPVIAAMQGHGIGAGWTLGMFADVVLLSEESRYVSPYMNFGFTPGAGATWILAETVGHDLARESLLTGQHQTGSELKQRGLLLPVLPQSGMEAAAMTLARQIARASRGRLIGLKRQLMAYVHQTLEETYRLELAMHEKTFVGRSDTLAQIQNNFYQEIETSSAGVQPARVDPARGLPGNASTASDVLSAVTASLKTLLADELHMRENEIDEDVEFVELGLDSINGVTWLRKINEKYRTSIEATRLYNYPTLTQFSRYVTDEAEKNGALLSQGALSAVSMPVASGNGPSLRPRLTVEKFTSLRSHTASKSTSAPSGNPSHSIAVIGMSGQFPQAGNLQEFWRNLEQGKNCITQVPPSRWNVNRYYDPDADRKDKTNSKWLGSLDDIDCFDSFFFHISPQEAEYIDPQHRLFLQESYKAFEDAGYASNALSNNKCGVYLGISTNEYMSLLAQNGVSSAPVTSNSYAVAAARIAYYLNLKGPAISVDTACSSSLVAIHLASQALLSGEIDMALAGGVSLWLIPQSYLAMSQAGMLSSIGQCRTFDDMADGIVLGEGVGAVVLKRLKDAQEDNDFIYGVILGSGINQDGRTNGITAPSINSQIELERSVYARHEIDPETISYVETHGTGTKLGDPIELEALATVFREKTARKNYCALGSVKSNIGHTAAAAGIASVQKVLLSMRHRILAPTLNVKKENSHFDFANSPFYICQEKRAWDVAPGSLRRAAVSSFGFSGTNAHLVIEEYLSPVRQTVGLGDNTKVIVPLSARSPEQLRQRARDLLEFIGVSRQGSQPVDLGAMAYTLQVGRDAMEERLGFVVSSAGQLAEKLSAYLNGEKNIDDVRQGRVEPGNEGMTIIGRDDDMQEAIVRWIERGKLSKLLDLWIRGLKFDWNRLYGGVKLQRVSLPTYPFAKDRHWIQQASPDRGLDERTEENVNMKAIEDIINRIEDGTVETERAVEELKMLV